MARKKQFAILGLGRFGMSMAKTLSEKGFDVMAVDEDPDAVQIASEFVTHAVRADVTDELSMRSLGVGNFDVVVVAIASHLESSAMATLIVKEMGIKYIVAKAKDDMQKKILEKIGADRVIFPEREMGTRIANSLVYGNFFEFMELSDEFGIAEFEPLKEWVGKTLAQTEIRAKYGLNVVAVKSNGRVEASPRADRVFKEREIIIVMGESTQIQRFLDKNSKRGEGY